MTIPNKNNYIERNPFYILNISCLDDRRRIISASEEMGFLLDPDVCAGAQNILITPNKRLSAELDWFIETNPSIVREIRKYIDAGESIAIDGLLPLSKLNAMIYNFSISEESDSFGLGLEILDIDKQFAALDLTVLTECINDCRTIAKMAEASEAEVSIELNKKRERIRIMISEKLQSLKETDYIELVTVFAEKYIADEEYNDSGIISDIIDQYEIWAKSKMDIKEDEIRNQLKTIERIDDNANLNKTVNELISLIFLIKEWNRYARPLQVSFAVRGMEDRNSRNIAMDIRELAIYLHNEKGNTELSLKIIEALKQCFVEVPEVFELVSRDAETLHSLQEKTQEFERKKKSNRRVDKTYSVRVSYNKTTIPPFCTCCMQPTENKEHIGYSVTTSNGNTRTTRSIGIDLPICKECLSHRRIYKAYLAVICSLSIIVGIVSMLLFIAQDIEIFTSGLISGGIIAGVYYLLSFLLKTKEMPGDHSARVMSASMYSPFLVSSNNPPYILTFTNWEYCQLFASANNIADDDITENIKPNTAKSIRVLVANDRHVATMLKMLAMFAAIAFIIGFLMTDGGDYIFSNGSSSSSYGSNATLEEIKFSQSVKSGTKVYEDIVSIFPGMGIYEQGSSNYSGFVCECKTSSGSSVWVYMSVSEHRSNFDSSASSSISNEYAKEVTFSSAKKIRGTAKTSNSVLAGLSTDIGAMILIDFTSVH